MPRSSELNRHVVISGVGVVSPIGIGFDLFQENLLAGKCGVARMDSPAFSGAPGNVGAEIKEFTDSSAKSQYLKAQKKSIKVMCREIQLGVASASLAMEHAALDLEAINHERFGVDFGANLMFSPPDVLKDACWSCSEDEGANAKFHYDQWGGKGMGSLEPLWLLRYLPNMPACHIGIYADARGPSNSITLDEASGNLAIAEAFHVITRDLADLMIAGTTGTRVHPVKSMHAAMWDQLADFGEEPPETWSRPFDRTRMGQVLGEGACSFILEEEGHARARGARIYGRILGAASSCVIDRSGTPGITHALVNAMKAALRDAGIKPEQVGHINAHGLGTPQSDLDETAAIQAVFGPLSSKVPVTALKSSMGNSGSGCGTLELAGSLAGLAKGVVPTTLNYRHPDPACPLNIVRDQPLPTSNRVVLNVNVTRMGQASALIVDATVN